MNSDGLPVAICSDHAGFELKEFILDWLTANNILFTNFGTYSADSCDYPDFVHPMCEAIENGESKIGIAICGSGEGMTITANKHQEIRAGLCWNTEIATLIRKHNNANVCCLPARFISKELAIDIIKIFFKEKFEAGRHVRRINKIPVKD